MITKRLAWVLSAIAVLFTSSLASPASATADDSVPSLIYFAAAPGVLTGAASAVTTIGSSATLAADEPSRGWAIASIVTGSLSLTAGGIYTGVVADNNAMPGVFGVVAASNFALGASSLVLGIVGVSADVPQREMGFVPVVTVDAEGRPFAQVSGTF